MKYLNVLIFSFLFLFSGCFSKPTVLDFGFEKLKNFTEFDVLPDGVPVYFEDYAFILTNPNYEYKHGILGDSIESYSLTFFNSSSIKVINLFLSININQSISLIILIKISAKSFGV